MAFLQTDGTRIVCGDSGEGVVLRGIAMERFEFPVPDETTYRRLTDLGLNSVRLVFSYRDFYDSSAPTTYKAEIWDWIDAHVEQARRHGLWVILHDLEVEGSQPVPISGVPLDGSIWHDAELQDRFLGLWRTIAERYRNESQIAGFSLFFEPVPSEGLEQWRSLAQRAIETIRALDPHHLIFVERIYGELGQRRELTGLDFAPDKAFPLVDDPNVVAEFYYFERDEYTHQFAPWREDLQQERFYPHDSWMIRYRETTGFERTLPFTREYLEFYLDRQLEFGRDHGLPMSIWGFGAMAQCFENNRGGLQWYRDVMDILNDRKVNWTLWGFVDDQFGVAGNPEVETVISQAMADAISQQDS
ncbi:MAG: cellulase family glycosylhydrolase [Acidimicrobiia bacterium]|nr:cellulase family glycosylhydrolase [Acidimicrobiia bacterium]